MQPSAHKKPEHVPPVAAERLSVLLDEYQPMMRLLSTEDLGWLESQGHSGVAQFRKQRAAIYFQYLGELHRDLRALPLWSASCDGESFIEQDRASWLMYRTLVRLAIEGVLYYIGIERREHGFVERCFNRLGALASADA